MNFEKQLGVVLQIQMNNGGWDQKHIIYHQSTIQEEAAREKTFTISEGAEMGHILESLSF